MIIYPYDPDKWREIKEYDSDGAFIYPIVQLNAGATLHHILFDPHSTIGGHKAVGPQLFLVVDGEGWVRSQEPEPIPVSRGDMVFWEAGEWHKSGSDSGMTVIVIESPLPGPQAFRLRNQ